MFTCTFREQNVFSVLVLHITVSGILSHSKDAEKVECFIEYLWLSKDCVTSVYSVVSLHLASRFLMSHFCYYCIEEVW